MKERQLLAAGKQYTVPKTSSMLFSDAVNTDRADLFLVQNRFGAAMQIGLDLVTRI